MNGETNPLTTVAGWRTRAARAAAVVTVPVLVAVLALLDQGFPLARVDLNDGAVWVTATEQLRLGRYNVQVEELNGGVVTTGSTFDVLQDAGDVLLVEPATISVIDPAGVTTVAQVAATAKDVSMASGTVAVLGEQGEVWVRSVATLEGLSVGQDVPEVSVGDGGSAVVARSGAVLAVAADGTVTRVDLVDGTPAVSPVGSLEAGAVDALTAVGDEPVVLSGAVVRTLRGEVTLPEEDVVLQQPGPSSDRVLVAGRSALYEVPLDGSDIVVHRTEGAGVPAAPVQVGACAHAAWASASGSYLRLCDGAEPYADDLEDMQSTDALQFRVNRSMVLLNDTRQGRLWMPQQDTDLRVPNWQDVVPQEQPEQAEEESEGQETTQEVSAECSAQSAPPTAADDQFGVRPGRATVLPVLANDSSSDCGILAISQVDALDPAFGRIEAVQGGRALQVQVTAEATGSATLSYTISDGRGTTAPSTATLTLTVREPGTDEPPAQSRVSVVQVEAGGQVERDVLADFADPDGDDLLLVGAAADPVVGTARFRQDGTVTFLAGGDKLGRTRVTVQVSDGTTTVEGYLDVDVRAAGSLPPQVDPVHAVTYVDEAVTLRPLDSVRTTGGEPARLAGVDEVVGATVVTDLDAGTFSFSAARAATYYVTFVVAAAPQQATGVARIDVRERPEQAQPPIAMRDTAFLPAGGQVTIDPLDNDTDPAGGVLVLQQVETGDASGLQIAVLEHRLVQVRSQRTLEAPVVVRYTVSNGTDSAVGEIVVQPVPPSGTSQPPVVEDVEVSVRTGGVVTIPVLQSAYDPDGDTLTLVSQLPEPLAAGQGLLFVSGDVLRYQAPATTMTVRATFAVRDSTGNESSASVTVRVHESDAEAKALPRPQDLTARVFEGDSVRITVPLVGIDADGDGVTLLGVAEPPVKGQVVEVGADYLVYEALPGEVGTDTFTYAVEDWVGQRAVATVRVGIAPQPTGASQVVARDDEVTVRPGQQIEVRVLANDVDSAGGELTLDPTLEVPAGVEARVEGRRLIVQAPSEAAVLQIAYTVTNERGGRDTGILTVNVTADAPVVAPVARDVVVPAIDTLGRTEVEVDVLAVAQNPSGPLSDLEVSVPSAVADVARVTPTGTVVVTLVDHAQTLPYLLTNTTDPTGQAASYAFVTVPALGFFPPTRRPNAEPLRVASGEQLVIALGEQIQVAPGRTASVSDPLTVSATRSDGTSLVRDATTLQFTSAAGYAGPASVTLTVTDATGAGDTTARTATITLPITVYALEDNPPTFLPSTLDVAPGEAPITVDLRAFTTGPEGEDVTTDRYTYKVSSDQPAGFSAVLTGSLLKVSADATTAKGATGRLDLVIGYGATGTIEAAVDLRVIASSRRVALVNDRTVTNGVEGKDTTVPVLEGAWNPFPDSPLTVVGATVETPGAGTASATSSTVTARPSADFVGTMVVRFRVRDVTGDPDREVEARLTVVVRGAPATPTPPRIGEIRDRTVVLSWDAPDSRGEAITGYRVVASPGNLVTQCSATTCTITGLTNDQTYTFTVAAQNAVDWSPPSLPSAPARPDAVPEAPGAPSLSFGDGSITATWNAPASPGSPVSGYDVMISPAPLSGPSTAQVSTTHHTITGLKNGTAYSVVVRARNKATDTTPAPWSAASIETPAAVPDAPAVTATRQSAGGSTPVIVVTWAAPASNGDAVKGYEVRVDGATVATLGADDLDHVISPAERGREYAISVRATNKAGWSGWGQTTGETWTAPTAPRSLTLTGRSGGDWGQGTARLSWSAPTDAGGTSVSISRYTITDGGGFAQDVPGWQTSLELTGLTAGQVGPYTVVAVNSRDLPGEAAQSGSATVQTKPQPPSLSVTTGALDQVNISATLGGAGVASGVQTAQYRFGTNGSWVDGLPPSTYTQQGGTVTVQVRASNSLGGWTDVVQASASPGSPQAPSAPTVTLDGASTAASVVFTWEAPPDGGRSITRYDWEVRDGNDVVRASGQHAAGSTPLSETVTGLPAGCRVRVRAVNVIGAGAWSTDVAVT
ncbi:Ig-like domain-containing protein [Cellulomonas soli]|uniref:Ig-like domain-containing protein n=1 Tax=Cellulomonas soli TaxID=931535 RepID=UPI003F86E5FC